MNKQIFWFQTQNILTLIMSLLLLFLGLKEHALRLVPGPTKYKYLSYYTYL